MLKKNIYLKENGHLNDEYISLYIDALLLSQKEQLPLEVLEHVEDCKLCKQSIIDGYDVLKTSGGLNIKEHPYFGNNEPNSKKNSIIYRIAASIIVLISLGVIGYYLSSKIENSEVLSEKTIVNDSSIQIITASELPKDTIKESESIKADNQLEKKIVIKKKEQENLLAVNDLSGKEYQISPVMISMLGNNTRTSFFEIEYPKDSLIIEINQPIKFNWDSDIDEEIQIKIFDYKDQLVFESEKFKNESYTLTKNLAPGAYIWKIESIDEIYHLGLFFIK